MEVSSQLHTVTVFTAGNVIFLFLSLLISQKIFYG